MRIFLLFNFQLRVSNDFQHSLPNASDCRSIVSQENIRVYTCKAVEKEDQEIAKIKKNISLLTHDFSGTIIRMNLNMKTIKTGKCRSYPYHSFTAACFFLFAF